MLQDLNKRVEGLDVNKSAFMSQFSFATLKGKTYLSPSPVSFVENFNKVFGELLSVQGTQMAGGVSCILSYLDNPTVKEQVPVEEPILVQEEEVITESPSEEVLEPQIDLAYAKTLSEGKSKKAAKEALETYAREFGIELNRSQTFNNMIKTLEESI